MVNFGQKLLSNQVAGWSAYYVDYNALKKVIKNVERRAKALERKYHLEDKSKYPEDGLEEGGSYIYGEGDGAGEGEGEGEGSALNGNDRDMLHDDADEYYNGSVYRALAPEFNLPSKKTSRGLVADYGAIASTEKDTKEQTGAKHGDERDERDEQGDQRYSRRDDMDGYSGLSKTDPDREYKDAIDRECKKVEDFYWYKLEELKMRYDEARKSLSGASQRELLEAGREGEDEGDDEEVGMHHDHSKEQQRKPEEQQRNPEEQQRNPEEQQGKPEEQQEHEGADGKKIEFKQGTESEPGSSPGRERSPQQKSKLKRFNSMKYTVNKKSKHKGSVSESSPQKDEADSESGSGSEILDHDPDLEEDEVALPRETLSKESLRRSFVDIYRQMNYLLNFSIINYTAFVKISKKHDKSTGMKTRRTIMRSVHKNAFCKARELKILMNSLEHTHAEAFHGGNITVARSDLLMKHRPRSQHNMLQIGMRFGFVILLLVWVLWDVVVDAAIKENGVQIPPQVFQVYRGMGSFVISYWLFALTIYVWNSARINYLFLFELDVRYVAHHMDAMLTATRMSFLYLANLLVYIKTARGEITFFEPYVANWMPLLLFVYMVGSFFFSSESHGAGLVPAIVSVVSAPFGEVTFFTAFIADIMTSMVKPFVDVAFSLCFFFSGEWKQLMYAEAGPHKRKHYHDSSSSSHSLNSDNNPLLSESGKAVHAPYSQQDAAQQHQWCSEQTAFTNFVVPIVLSLPLVWRFLQNLRRYYDTRRRFPTLPNAFKYFLSFTVVIFGAFHPGFYKFSSAEAYGLHGNNAFRTGWFVVAITSTLYSIVWDIRMDWGLGGLKHQFLRGRLMYGSKRFYYFAICFDVAFRMLWALTLIPSVANFFDIKAGLALYMTALISWAELLRRCVWSFFRVEWEHLSNTQGYRRVDWVPLHFDTPLEHLPEHLSRGKQATMALEMGFMVFLMIVVGSVAFTMGRD